MTSTEKVISLYKYIKELCALKYKVITDISKQEWVCPLKDIPDDPDNITQYFRDRIEEEATADMTLLKVHKPEFQQCPQPPAILNGWLESEWDKYTNPALHKEVLIRSVVSDTNFDEVQSEHFTASDSRVHAYERWSAIRATWVEHQRRIYDTRRCFAKLFQAYTDLERESETLEFMVGNGLVKDQRNPSISHPVLLKRVKFEFDAKENTIRIVDTDTEPEIYTLLFQGVSDIDHSAIQVLKEELRENDYHPLDRNDTPDFLKVLTHRLCSESKFIANEEEYPDHSDKIVTYIAPTYFIRKRIDGTLRAIEEIIAHIESTGRMPGHLLDLVAADMVEVPIDEHEPTIDEQLGAISGESTDILLSKEANREQLEIAQRIEHYNAVLVQGPPGTGKTHTIANLLGHFLAEGKNVLVTSQTKKALSVLKEQVPVAIQNLCVSILDDTNLDMVRSVEGISEFLSHHTSLELKRKMEVFARQRNEVIQRLAQVRKRIYSIKYKEFQPVLYNGESFSPAKAAEFVNHFAAELSYIPGKVKLGHPLPSTVEELYALYRSNVGFSTKDETELACELPNPELVMSPVAFLSDLQAFFECQNTLDRVSEKLKKKLKCDLSKGMLYATGGAGSAIFASNPTGQAVEQLESYVNSFRRIEGWMIHAAIDGYKGGGYRQKWEILITSIQNTAAYAESIVTLMLGKTIAFAERTDLQQLKPQAIRLQELFQKKGKISKLDLFMNKSLEITLSQVTINAKPPTSAEDCELVLRHMELLEKRNETAQIWDELMAKQGSPAFFALGAEPEEACRQRIPNIRRYLDWYQNEQVPLLELIERAGLNADLILNYSDLDTELVRTEKALCSVCDTIPLHVQAAKALVQLREIEGRRIQSISVLSENKRKNSTVCEAMCNALHHRSIEHYEENYRALSQLFEKYTLQRQREEVLAKISPFAPEWADAISNRRGLHGKAVCPETIEDAWKWKQLAGMIDEITSQPFEELQRDAVALGKDLRKATAELAAHSAWYHLLLKTERELAMRQALQGWKLTVKKIGKGTGKNAPALRKEARELMAKCQAAVPAWIMPVSKALESLDPATNCFDVVIVDEASQSDVSALAIMYMAKKVIIVGDDKQVSPMAVGIDVDRINALCAMYIKDVIPNWHLYDAKTSLYDIAGTTYQPLMLREHFRCVPDIIGYSNKLSYDFKIKPLRDVSNCPVTPPVISFRVDGGQREGGRKINQREAQTTVALMMACMERPEYSKQTFGAISLLGDEQAKLIQQLVFEKIEPSVIEERRILCGNASHFQGDERDIIFLSLVDSNEGDGPLRMTGEGADQSTKQRYNVAASRAKNQLWVIHSLDFTKDLRSGDIRRDLLEYTENPRAYAQQVELVRTKAESPFEEAVGNSLIAAGYHIAPQWEVGAYRLDMVALYQGQKVAIECDGELYHSGDEKVRSDMERQTILERMGWRFVRIRGSEYYRAPEAAMARVIKELNAHGIYPENMVAPGTEVQTSELLSRVKIRAAQLLDEWHKESQVQVPNAEQEIKRMPPRGIPQPLKRLAQLSDSKETHEELGQMKFAQVKAIQPDAVSMPQKSSIVIAPSIRNPSTQSVSSAGSAPCKPIGKQEQIHKPTVQSPAQSHPAKPSDSVSKPLLKGEEIIFRLNRAQISYIDKRSQSGIIWVLFSEEIKARIADILKGSPYLCSLERRGSLATSNQPAWRIMIG